MKQPQLFLILLPMAVLRCWAAEPDSDSIELPAAAYQIYAGSTHAHTSNTWSHGDHFIKAKKENDEGKEPALTVSTEGVQTAPKGKALKADWQKHQGAAAQHFDCAKTNGYDFYSVTDHSQEATFHPVSSTNEAWVSSKRDAAQATDAGFVAISGYEHSENNGPGGKGHLNVFNSADYLNALAPGVDLKRFYEWLKTAKPIGEGPVVASFNHPGPKQYDDWAGRDPEVTDIITLLEVINSNKGIHYQGFLSALDHGWKVSPVCGNDNHGFYGIMHQTSRTFVLATNKSKAAILDSMKNRRTYASLDNNIQCRYTVNGAVMGSTLNGGSEFEFDISINDADTGKPGNKITKIDIVKDHGAVVQTFTPEPAFSIRWKPKIQDPASKYFFVRVWNAAGGDAPGADPAKPIAWLAPVWTGR
jgi:hypothetical protein